MKRRDLSTLSLVTQLGFTVVTALVLSLLLGLWLDSRLGTSPLFILVFSMFGVLVGTIGVYRLVTKAIAASAASLPRPKARSTTDLKAPADDDRDPWSDDWGKDEAEEDDWDRDPWDEQDEEASEKRRAGREDVERRLGARPPKLGPRPAGSDAGPDTNEPGPEEKEK